MPIRVRRRDLLAGLGKGALFVAPFAQQVKAWAAGKPGKSNLVIYFTPNGHARSQFGSDGNDAGFKFRTGASLAEPMADHISVVRGLSIKSQHTQAPFHDQITRLLTTVSGPVVATAQGRSLDQAVAELAMKQPINLKVYWSRYENVGTYQNLSWRAAALPNRNYNDPRQAYKLVFGEFMPGGGNEMEVTNLIDQQKSVMDFLKRDIELFRGRLTRPDQARLAVHQDALRDFEKKLTTMPATGGAGTSAGACPMTKAKPAETSAPPNDSGPYNKELFKAHADVQLSLMVASLACGARNAGTVLMQGAAGGLNPWGTSGKGNDHHLTSHGEAGYNTWVDIDRWYSGRYADFLKELQGVGILDDTVVVWATEISEQHSHNNYTMVVGGGKNLGFKGRKTASFPFQGNEGGGRNAARAAGNRSMSDLWTTCYRACGGQGNFGEDVAGPITEIWSG
jgi:hypothetical protein